MSWQRPLVAAPKPWCHDRVDGAVRKAFRQRLCEYHRATLAEAALDLDHEPPRLTTYTEFRRRLDDPAWNLNVALAPARAALSESRAADLEVLRDSLASVRTQVAAIMAQPPP